MGGYRLPVLDPSGELLVAVEFVPDEDHEFVLADFDEAQGRSSPPDSAGATTHVFDPPGRGAEDVPRRRSRTEDNDRTASTSSSAKNNALEVDVDLPALLLRQLQAWRQSSPTVSKEGSPSREKESSKREHVLKNMFKKAADNGWQEEPSPTTIKIPCTIAGSVVDEDEGENGASSDSMISLNFNYRDLLSAVVSQGLRKKFPDFPSARNFAAKNVFLVTDSGVVLEDVGSSCTGINAIGAAAERVSRRGSKSSPAASNDLSRPGSLVSSPRPQTSDAESLSPSPTKTTVPDSHQTNLHYPCEFISVVIRHLPDLHFPTMVADLHQALVTGTYVQRSGPQSSYVAEGNGNGTGPNLMIMQRFVQQQQAGMLPGLNVGGPPGNAVGGVLLRENVEVGGRNGLVGGGGAQQLPVQLSRQTYILPSLEHWEIGLFQSTAADLRQFSRETSSDQIYGFPQLLQVIDRVKSANFVYPANLNLVFSQEELQNIGGLGAFLAEVASRCVASPKMDTNVLEELWTYREMKKDQPPTKSDQWHTGCRVRRTTIVHEILKQLRVFQVFELRHGLKAAVDGDKLTICARLLKNLALRGNLILAEREELWNSGTISGDLLRSCGNTNNRYSDHHDPSKRVQSHNATFSPARRNGVGGGGNNSTNSSLQSSYLSRALFQVGSTTCRGGRNGNGFPQGNSSTSGVLGTNAVLHRVYSTETNNSSSPFRGLQSLGVNSDHQTWEDNGTSDGNADCASSTMGAGTNYGSVAAQHLAAAEAFVSGFSPPEEVEKNINVPVLDTGSSVEEELWCLYKHLMSNKLEYSWISLRWTCLQLILTLGERRAAGADQGEEFSEDEEEEDVDHVHERHVESEGEAGEAGNEAETMMTSEEAAEDGVPAVEGKAKAPEVDAGDQVVEEDGSLVTASCCPDASSRCHMTSSSKKTVDRRRVSQLTRILLRRVRSLVARRFQDLGRFHSWNEKKLTEYDPWNASNSEEFPDDFYEYQFLYASEMHRRQMDSSQLRQKSVGGVSSPILSRSAAMSPRGVVETVTSSSVNVETPPATERPTVADVKCLCTICEMHRRQMDSSQLRQKTVGGVSSPILSVGAMSPRGVVVETVTSSSVRSVETPGVGERPTVGAGGTRSILPTTPNKTNNDHVDGVDHRVVVTLAGLSETEIAEGGREDADGTSKATAEDEEEVVGGKIQSCSNDLATSAPSKWNNNSPAAADTDTNDRQSVTNMKDEHLLDQRRQEALAVVTALHKTLQNDAVGIAAELLQCLGGSASPKEKDLQQIFVAEIASVDIAEPLHLSAIKLYLASFVQAFN